VQVEVGNQQVAAALELAANQFIQESWWTVDFQENEITIFFF